MNLLAILFFICGFIGTGIYANPFAIDFPEKEVYSREDYIHIQNQLRAVHIEPLLQSLYPVDQGYTTYDDFRGRCSRGIHQILIDPDRGLFPEQHFEKINNGGDNCIVCCVPLDQIRPNLVRSIAEALRETGFNGYFLYLIGGYPNPTGKEIRYIGVPYCFKIFMMREAQKLGFNKVLWIDSAALPLRDPTPLFDWIDYKGAFINGWKCPPHVQSYLLPATQKLLKEQSGIDVLNATYVGTVIFGLKMDTMKTKRLLEEYYRLAEMGTPFMSCYPEEFVLTALLGKIFDPPSEKSHPFVHLIKRSRNLNESKEVRRARREGYFFFNRKH